MSAPAACAQRLTKSELTGVIASAQVETAAPIQATLLAAPSNGSLVVTQACVDRGQAGGQTRIAGSTFGRILESSVATAKES